MPGYMPSCPVPFFSSESFYLQFYLSVMLLDKSFSATACQINTTQSSFVLSYRTTKCLLIHRRHLTHSFHLHLNVPCFFPITPLPTITAYRRKTCFWLWLSPRGVKLIYTCMDHFVQLIIVFVPPLNCFCFPFQASENVILKNLSACVWFVVRKC